MVLCGVAIGIIKDRFTIPGEFVNRKMHEAIANAKTNALQ